MIQLLKEAVPALATVGVLWDSNVGLVQFQASEAATKVVAAKLVSLPVKQVDDLHGAFVHALGERADAVVVLSSPLIFANRAEIAQFALRASLPTICLFTNYPRSGGLMAYGPNFPAVFKRSADYLQRIVKGASAAEMPIERPSRFELIINLKTAKLLGLEIPWFLQQSADEVIE